jgi:hypothetical protein
MSRLSQDAMSNESWLLCAAISSDFQSTDCIPKKTQLILEVSLHHQTRLEWLLSEELACH